jgi:hypothetical protein
MKQKLSLSKTIKLNRQLDFQNKVDEIVKTLDSVTENTLMYAEVIITSQNLELVIKALKIKFPLDSFWYLEFTDGYHFYLDFDKPLGHLGKARQAFQRKRIENCYKSFKTKMDNILFTTSYLYCISDVLTQLHKDFPLDSFYYIRTFDTYNTSYTFYIGRNSIFKNCIIGFNQVRQSPDKRLCQ